jgi:hypothetical protein
MIFEIFNKISNYLLVIFPMGNIFKGLVEIFKISEVLTSLSTVSKKAIPSFRA